MSGSTVANTVIVSGLKSSGPKWLLASTIFLTYMLMVMGNLVTTTGSGLACPDWPLCYGSVNPPKELSIWLEWGHRLIGGATGILTIFSVAYMWKRANKAIRFFMKALVALLLFVAVLGGVIVLVEAPLLNTFFRVALVSSHIILATIIFTSLILAFYAISDFNLSDRKLYSLSLFAVIYFQVILGIVVRYSKSSLGCPDFPLCFGNVFPPSLEPKILLHYTHRLFALGVFILALWRMVKNYRQGREQKLVSAITFVLVLTQATIGSLIVLTKMFYPLLILHGAMGFALLGWVAYQAAPYIVPPLKSGEEVGGEEGGVEMAGAG
ncbi:MAG: COX15/CtaA family protein [Nitrospinota bacterium]